MGSYVNTPVYANQISAKQINKNGNGFYFVRLNAKDTINSETIKTKYGNVKSISIMVPDFAIKGAKVSKIPDKTYNLDKDTEGKIIEFDPLVLSENKEKVSGKHILAIVSLKMPETDQELNDETKIKVIMTIFNEETQTFENKTITTSAKKLAEDLFKQNTINVTNSIRKFKDKAKDIFSEFELAKEVNDEPKNNYVKVDDLFDEEIVR